MSKGGSGGTQTTTQQTQLPDWVNQAAQSNYALAQQVSANLMKPYSGQRVADLTPGMTGDIGLLQGNIGSTNPTYNQAIGTMNGLQGFQMPQVNPQTLAGTNLSPYMNPYTSAVINPTMALMEQQRQQALNGVGQQASQQNAFGGSRQGVSEGVTNAQYGLNEAQMAGGLLSNNFNQAQAAATGDITRNLTAQQLNQAAAATGAGIQANAATGAGNLASGQQQNWLQGMQAAMGGQQMLTSQQQQQLNAAMQYYTEQQQYPIQQLQILQNALQVSPYGTTTTTTGPGPSSNAAMQGIGGALGLLGTFGSLATPGAGGISALGNLFSDRRLKKDVEKIGRDDRTGLNIYAFRYKGDPPSYPKVAGPMAQEVERKYPDQVVRIGGYRAIKGNFLAGMQEAA